jgi:hypothetical protein
MIRTSKPIPTTTANDEPVRAVLCSLLPTGASVKLKSWLAKSTPLAETIIVKLPASVDDSLEDHV